MPPRRASRVSPHPSSAYPRTHYIIVVGRPSHSPPIHPPVIVRGSNAHTRTQDAREQKQSTKRESKSLFPCLATVSDRGTTGHGAIPNRLHYKDLGCLKIA